MNIKHVLCFLILSALVLAACAPAAAPTAANPSTLGQKSPSQAPAYQRKQPAPTQAIVAVQPQTMASTSAPVFKQPGSVPSPADNYFQDYGVNPFVDSSEDHLSTFALDVDTASYTVARRYIQDGNFPPADSVRVEEFVNYFDQGYPSPQDIAFGIYADGAPSPFTQDGAYLLRFGIQGYRVPEGQRKPLSLTFVIDISGSMGQENRLELVKQSLQLLVDRLQAGDTVGVVVYGSQARILLNPTSGSDRGAILDAIYSLHPEDSTNAEAGLKLGYTLAMQAYQPGATNRVILCSDGVANVGETSPDAILAEVHGYVEEGITLTTVGFGMGNFNDVLLEQLADHGDGNYAYVDNMEEAQRLFIDNLTATLQVIALDAKVQVDFNSDVVSRYRLIGYENRAVADQDFRNDAVDAGELGAGHSATALYAVQLKPGAQGRIATVQLRWQDPETRQVKEINGNFNSWDLAQSFEETSARYQLAVVVAQYAEVLRRSPWALDTSLSLLSAYAVQINRQLPEDAEVSEFVKLVTRAGQIYP